MKKILLSFVAFLLMAFAVFAGNGVVSWTGADDWTSQADTALTLVQEPYTIVLTKSGACCIFCRLRRANFATDMLLDMMSPIKNTRNRSPGCSPLMTKNFSIKQF